jgi:lambda family phage portal protein
MADGGFPKSFLLDQHGQPIAFGEHGHGSHYGAYKGASWQRDAMFGWWPRRGAPDELVARDLDTLRRRAADLIRNNPIAAGATHTKVQGVVGTGIKVHATIDRETLGLDDPTADAWERRAERLFGIWAASPESHIKRGLTFYEQQDIAFRAVLGAGDHFVQLAGSSSGALPFRLALQHISAARVCNPFGYSDTEALVKGIERDAAGAPLAYQVANRHPEAARLSEQPLSWTRVPAFNAATGRRVTLHLYRALDDDQTRGIPDLAPVMEVLKQLDRFTDAEVDAAVKTALFAIVVKTQTGQGLAGMAEVEPWADARKAFYTDRPLHLRDGSAAVLGLFPDDEVSAFDPIRPNSGYDPFMAAILKQVGAALELPYEVLTKAFMSSYSASRAALLQAYAFFLGRRIWLASKFCQPVYEAFLDEQIATGRLAAPGYFADPLIRAAYLGSRWVGDAPLQLDEGAAVTAARERIELGVSTLTAETAALTGEDWEQVRRQRDKEIRRGGIVTPKNTGSGPTVAPPQRPAEAMREPEET